MTATRKQIALAIVCLAAAVLAVWAGARGGAQVLAYAPRELMDQWYRGQLVADPERWERASAQLIRAQGLVPDDADLHVDLGRMAALRASWEPVWSDDAGGYQRSAIEHYRRALEARPSWGLAWAYLARELARHGRLSEGGLAALDKAMVLAPMEQATQQEVIWLGASIWPRLDETQRQQLKRIMKNALRALPDQVADAAIAYGLVEEIRPLLENEAQHRLLEQRLRAFGQGG